MKPLILIVFLVEFIHSQGQTDWSPSIIETNGYASTPRVLDAAIFEELLDYCQDHSVHRSDVDWIDIRAISSHIYDTIGLIGAMQHVLHELGDFHGRIWHDGIPYNGIRRPYVPTSMQPDSLTLVNYWQTSIPVKGDVLDGSIGYVLVPGMIWGATDSLNAHILYNTLEEIERQHHPNGWVVDLRLNGGGTMFPMLCGLSQLLGEADLGSFTDPDTHYKEIWHLQDGEFYLDSTQVTSYGVGQNLDLSRKPVVVLLSSGTTSSGEVVALAFKGRPNTYFIGEATGGYTSTVSWLEMGNGIAFQLTESWYADRDDHIFQGEPIVPDLILSEGDQVLDPEADAWVRRGIEWLREH